jgi:fucose permease
MEKTQNETKIPKSRLGLVLLAFIAFISLGLPDGLLGVAWPSIQSDFGLPLDALGILITASVAGYMTSSFLSGKLMNRLGVGGLLAISCALTGSALWGYTLAPVWPMMVFLGIFAGFGGGAIDAGINTYIAANFGERLMQWLHASFGIGVTLGPIIMTAGLNFFDSWRFGYRLVGTAQLLLAACFFMTKRLWEAHSRPDEGERQNITSYRTPLGQTLRNPGAWLSMLLFLVYTGAEVALGAWTYTFLTQERGIPVETAGLWAGSYWLMFTVGRFLAGFLTRRVRIERLIGFGILLAIAGIILLGWQGAGMASLLGVGITGFAIAPIFPGLVSTTPGRVSDRHTANTIGIQISAAGLGGALVPGLAGILLRRVGLEIFPVYMFICFVLLLGLYAFSLRWKPQPHV